MPPNVPALKIDTKRLRQANQYKHLVEPCDTRSTLPMGLICSIDCVPYEIQSALGKGAHGAVYKAIMYQRNEKTSVLKTVAIKVFLVFETFRDENKLMIELRGTRGVTQWIAASTPPPKGKSASNLIVMEYISGGDLKAFMAHPPMLLDNNKVLDIVKMFMVRIRVQLFIFLFVCYLCLIQMDLSYPLEHFNNEMQWIHADVKPENILVDMNGVTQNFYLSDMSVSLSMDDFTIKGAAGGTPVWYVNS